MNPAISTSQKTTVRGSNSRLQLWYLFLILVLAVFIGRLFYLQVIKYDHYHQQALSRQLKQYSIPAQRGMILAYLGDNTVPLVLNQKLYTLFADPLYVKNPEEVAAKLSAITGAKYQDYLDLMKIPNTRYVVLAKKLTKAQSEKIDSLGLRGVGTREAPYRIYPQGVLASQLLGFVDADGEGQYGIEQSLNSELAGRPGELKAITDINGVPLVDNRSNIKLEPVPGKDVVLSIDIAIQKQMEDILKTGLKRAQSKSGSLVVMDVNSGQIKAMANYPTYDPSAYDKVTDISLFNNDAVASAMEPGSTMKMLTLSAALDTGAISLKDSYDDPARWLIDGHYITNVAADGGAAHRTVYDIINYSLNTGATWLLMQMSKQGDTIINDKGRTTWHNYMTDSFRLGKITGIEQGYESAGYVPDPTKGDARDLTYSNTSFGQSVSVTMVQMAAAYSAILNGGTFYQPSLVSGHIDETGKFTGNPPKILKKNIISKSTSDKNIQVLKYVAKKLNFNLGTNYTYGGKTGTAQIANPNGGYYEDRFNGTFVGYVGGDRPQYVVALRVNEPKSQGYAGPYAARPVYFDAARALINNFGVTPKSH